MTRLGSLTDGIESVMRKRWSRIGRGVKGRIMDTDKEKGRQTHTTMAGKQVQIVRQTLSRERKQIIHDTRDSDSCVSDSACTVIVSAAEAVQR